MNIEDAKKVLENSKKTMQKQRLINEDAEKKLKEVDEKKPNVFGPKTDLDYHRMLKDIKESNEND